MDRFLVDLSAWARSSHAKARKQWKRLVEEDQLIAHPVFAIECLHNSTTPTIYQEQLTELDEAFDWLWPDRDTAQVAMTLQRRMATNIACGQRVKTADLLTAALGIQHGVGVLHYDADYDQIEAFGGEKLNAKWLAPKGSLDTGSGGRDPRRAAYRKALGERMIQLQNDTDLEVWPKLIAWLDGQLSDRGLEIPPSPAV